MSDAERLLDALPRFVRDTAAFRPGTGRTAALLAALGDPHRGLPVVHVAGTNGKGSTASLAASIADAAGVRVGLHTSPHLVSVRERMRVGGVPAPAEWLDVAVERLAPALAAVGPSYFEAAVALSLLFFAERSVDLAVVEVGLGGGQDATNVADASVSVLTHVGLDHTAFLGDTAEAIAREKATVARPGVPFVHAVAGAPGKAAGAVAAARGAPVEAVRETCRAEVVSAAPLAVRLATPVRDYGEVAVGLAGAHHAWNAALAVRAAELAVPGVGADAVRAGLAEVVRRSGLRGRGERLAGGRIVLDVAHNAEGWRAALAALAVPDRGRLWALVGVMRDKDAAALGALLAGAGARALAVGLPGERGRSAESLADALGRAGVPTLAVADAAAALDAFAAHGAPDDRLLVTGSHETVAAVIRRTPALRAG